MDVRRARPGKGSLARVVKRAGFAAVLACAGAGFAAPGAGAQTGTTTDRYSLVKGCFALESASGELITQAGDGYSATAATPAAAEAFRMQATDLGKYLFFGEAQDFLGLDSGPLAQDAVIVETAPSGRTTWTVNGAKGEFTVVNKQDGLGLAVGAGDELVSVPEDQAESFTFVPAKGCAVYPEISLNATGEPNANRPGYGEVEGTADTHMHMMAFEFLGGSAHCGQPWHKFGAPYALADCVDHEPNGCSAVLETGLGGDPCHNTGGWPDFTGWPQSDSLTHESSYYRWLERAHLAGLRVFVNLMVENRVLCEVYPEAISVAQGETKSNCDEMDSVRREIQRIHELQDYIDAQSGGPGKGWFRIVDNPFQARKVINKGKLAVIQGMEVSEPFDCGYKGIYDPVPGTPTPDPRCNVDGPNSSTIDQWLDELWDLGVRQMEITNKFDNQLTGVAGDGGSTGLVVNSGQYLTSGSFWDFGPEKANNPQPGDCDEANHDRTPGVPAPTSQDEIFGNGLDAFLPSLPVLIPLYTAEQVCNKKGLQDGDPGETDLGAQALNGIMDRGFIFDPDHMSVVARDEALEMLEGRDYPGAISSHSWSTRNTLPRLYRLGGLVTPYAGDSSSFAEKWEELKSAEVRGELGDQYFGIGYGADANGFGSQGDPRNPAEGEDVDYPFTGIDGAVSFDRQMSGTEEEGRTYDINTDGVDHYGLYPDWLEDLRQIKGDAIVEDMNRGAEAYLQMWERTYGIREVDCSQWGDEGFHLKGLGTELRLNKKPKLALRKAGQPVERSRIWRWCAGNGGRESAKAVTAVFSKRNKLNWAISNVRRHEIDGVAPGDSKRGLRKVGTRMAKRVWISRTGGRRAFVWIAGKGEVTHTGVVSQTAAKKLNRLSKRLVKVSSR